MKIAYVDYYQSGQSPHKDPLTIPVALQQIGYEVVLISCNPAFDGIKQLNGLPVLSLEMVEEDCWSSFGFIGVVFASRLDVRFTPAVRRIRESGLRLVIKADTDGTWGHPIPPNYLRARPLAEGPINWLRHLKWRLPIKYWVEKKLEQVRLADAVIVESPAAAVNATSILLHWGLGSLAQKIRFIPNPVSPIALSLPLREQRCDRIVTVGRWEDRKVKNTKTMLCVVRQFLNVNKKFDFEIIGTGLDADEVSEYLWEYIDSGRVKIISELPYLKLQERLGQAKITLIPSTLESFCFVAAEALCAGSSIVATPIESLIYLTGGGCWGSIARGFGEEQILAALICEVEAWERGLKDSDGLSCFSRKRFDPHDIAYQFANLFGKE